PRNPGRMGRLSLGPIPAPGTSPRLSLPENSGLNRRSFILSAGAPLLAGAVTRAPIATLAQAAPGPAPETGTPFDPSAVRALARDLAQHDFKPPDTKLPDNLKDLTYDQYRAIRFLPERALWKDDHLRFQAQFFHRGFYYKTRVNIFQV